MRTTQKPLTRYNAGTPNEFTYYATGIPMRHLTRMLDRCERTIRDWLNGKAVIPPWAIAVLRLRHLEHELMKDQMGINEAARRERLNQPQAVFKRRPPANEAHFAVQLTLDMGNLG